MPEPMPYMRRPCDATQSSGPCPFRRDAPAGEFSAERFEELAATAGSSGREATFAAPVFACHHTTDSHPRACAGWLAVCGASHMGVRLALARRALPAEALQPGPDWPQLFDSYDEMATAQTAGAYRPDRAQRPGDLAVALLGAERAAQLMAQVAADTGSHESGSQQ